MGHKKGKRKREKVLRELNKRGVELEEFVKLGVCPFRGNKCEFVSSCDEVLVWSFQDFGIGHSVEWCCPRAHGGEVF